MPAAKTHHMPTNRFKCELLSADLLLNEGLLAELSYWLHVMRRPQGWHYDMDEIWALQNLEAASLPAGATILDAGAGLGLMQYILASRGYNVVSLDFGKRTVPVESRSIFDVRIEDQDGFGYKHPYQERMPFTRETSSRVSGTIGGSPLPQLLSKVLSRRPYYRLKRELLYSYFHRQEAHRPHDRYGHITFVRAAFHDIPYPADFFDAVVSFSALEHADTALLEKNLGEMTRVAKKAAPVLITTSATDNKDDVFHEKTHGWCFSAQTIGKFASNAVAEYANYERVERSILASSLWRSRLDPYYHLDPASDFYRKSATRLPYLPLALRREK